MICEKCGNKMGEPCDYHENPHFYLTYFKCEECGMFYNYEEEIWKKEIPEQEMEEFLEWC